MAPLSLISPHISNGNPTTHNVSVLPDFEIYQYCMIWCYMFQWWTKYTIYVNINLFRFGCYDNVQSEVTEICQPFLCSKVESAILEKDCSIRVCHIHQISPHSALAVCSVGALKRNRVFIHMPGSVSGKQSRSGRATKQYSSQSVCACAHYRRKSSEQLSVMKWQSPNFSTHCMVGEGKVKKMWSLYIESIFVHLMETPVLHSESVSVIFNDV